MHCLQGTENNAEEFGLEENICLLALGGRPGVLHHFSNDYESLRDAVGEYTDVPLGNDSYLHPSINKAPPYNEFWWSYVETFFVHYS